MKEGKGVERKRRAKRRKRGRGEKRSGRGEKRNKGKKKRIGHTVDKMANEVIQISS
jgi:hypothetical protein